MLKLFSFSLFISVSKQGRNEWVSSSTEPNIEYYYIAQCIGFSLSAGTTACKNLYPTATLASIKNAAVQAYIATNVIDGYPDSCGTGYIVGLKRRRNQGWSVRCAGNSGVSRRLQKNL